MSRRRQWHPTPLLLPGKSHGWRSLVGCSPWGREESDMTELVRIRKGDRGTEINITKVLKCSVKEEGVSFQGSGRGNNIVKIISQELCVNHWMEKAFWKNLTRAWAEMMTGGATRFYFSTGQPSGPTAVQTCWKPGSNQNSACGRIALKNHLQEM